MRRGVEQPAYRWIPKDAETRGMNVHVVIDDMHAVII